MKALSIRQPWAWLILHAGKDIENRTWSTRLRGRVLIHAAQGMTRKEYDEVVEAIWVTTRCNGALPPEYEQLQRGGIIGSVEIVDCVPASDSPWFFGPYGFKLANPQPLPFVPMKGKLGFFEVDESLLNSHD